MHLLARFRSLAARHPAAYWCVVLALAAVAATSMWHERARLAASRAAWGSTATVVVATTELAPGDPLAGQLVERPAAMVPPGAIDPADLAAAGRIVIQHIGVGEIVTRADLGDGLLALLPDGWLAVAVRNEPAPLPVAVGDAVTPLSGDVAVTEMAIVVAVEGDVVTIAVPPEAAGAVADAGRLQLLVLALRRPGAG